jgi:hypothetical protein
MDLSQSWAYIEQVANHRLANNQTERHVSEYGDYIELIGAAGELAARRFLQINEDLHEHFDSGADIIWKDIRIDVKATIWTKRIMKRFLQWPTWKQIKADAIVFTAINIDRQEAILLGYALPHDIGRAPLNTERQYQCYEIPIPKLRRLNSLLFAECRDDLYPCTKEQAQAYRRQNYNATGA